MSGIAGVWNLDGRPVERKVLQAMALAAAHRGPDGIGYWSDGPVGFAHLMLATTPEARRETQPLADETGTLHLTFDGRLDNREDLTRDLRQRGVEARDLTDAEIVLGSYRAWGEACAHRLFGDFAFALWDARQRLLFCARDILGWKPFHYYLDERVFVFASQVSQVLEHPDVPCEPDETTVAVHLAQRVDLQGDRSLFHGIRRLMPSHWMIVRPDFRKLERYWTPERREPPCRSDAEYAEHFREIFREAVRCRLRSSGPVGAYLSGGLDSSSVVGMAQSILRDGESASRADANGFDVFSLIFPGRSCDESRYIRAVKEMWGLSGIAVDPEEEGFHRYAEHVRLHRELPFYPNGAMLAPLLTRARDRGFRAILTGLGGDDWFGPMPLDRADALREGSIVELWRDFRRSRDFRGLWGHGLRPLLVSWLPPALRLAARRRKPIPPWLGEELARRVGLREIRAVRSPWEGDMGLARSTHVSEALGGSILQFTEAEERFASTFDLEYRHPCHDRRVIEFALSLPRDQRSRHGVAKFVAREALGDLIPGDVRERETKAEFSRVVRAGIMSLAGSFKEFETVDRGWARREEVRRMYDAFERGAPVSLWVLWRVFSLELWLRMVFNRDQGYLRSYSKEGAPMSEDRKPEPAPARGTYSRPELTEYGDLKSLTRGSAGTRVDVMSTTTPTQP